jgi:hypothetical protein
MNQTYVVDIVDSVTAEIVSHCYGPAADDRCPSANPDGIVLCQGCRIKGSGMGPECWNLWIPPTATTCPAGWHLDELGY